jgi:hypothetical protein
MLGGSLNHSHDAIAMSGKRHAFVAIALGMKAGRLLGAGWELTYLEWLVPTLVVGAGMWALVAATEAIERHAEITEQLLAFPSAANRETLLLIHSTGDQVGAAINAVHLFSWFLISTWRRVNTWAAWPYESGHGRTLLWFVPMTILVMAATWWPYSRFLSWAMDRPIPLAVLFFAAVTPVAWAQIAGSMLVATFAILALVQSLAFGLDIGILAFQFDIAAEQSPTGDWTIHNVTEAPTLWDFDALDHSRVYSNPTTIGLILSWMRHLQAEATKGATPSLNQ